MLNSTEFNFIRHLSNSLPDRKSGKRGTKPIDKYLLLEQLFMKFRRGLVWRDLEYSSTCRSYFKELQRRGLLTKNLNLITKHLHKNRLPETIVDSSDMESHKTNGLVAYSGKYHNNCIKMTVEITPEYVPINYRLDVGTLPDSDVFAKMVDDNDKLPYNIYLDKGYELYERRRELQKKNCQVRMEMKKYANSRKRGPRFTFTNGQKKQRGEIEKIFSWLKAFKSLRYNRMRLKSLITGMFVFCLIYLAFTHI